ncbi:hypothetical protein ACFLVO_02905 [Chloroflexota bacterium]
MFVVMKKCSQNDCGEEAAVFVDEKAIIEKIYTWTCPCCGNINQLPVATAKK